MSSGLQHRTSEIWGQLEKHSTTFIRGVLIPDADGGYGYTAVDVTFANGKIDALAPAGSAQAPEGAIVIDGANKLLLPGCVNAHTHTSEHWARGLIKPLPLELWIHQLVRHEPRGVEGGKLLGYDDPFLQTPPSLIGLETLMGGATAILDHLWVRNIDDVAAAVAAYRQLGIRVFLALMLADTEGDNYANYTACCPNAADRNEDAAAQGCTCGGMGPGGVFRVKPNGYDPVKTDAAVALWEEAIAKFHCPEDGINIAIGPTTCFSSSVELFRRGTELRRKHGLVGHTHCLETQGQVLQSRQFFGPEGCIGMLRDTGFLELPGTSLAHAVWLSDAEIAMVAQAGASVVHNPASNLRLGSGVAPLRKYRAAGVNVALGADGACSSDGQDMLEVMKLTTLLNTLDTREYRSWLEPKDVVRMATAGGYAAVNMAGKAGVISEGAEADLCLYDLTALSMLPLADPLGSLVLGRPHSGPGGAALCDAWVRGRHVIRGGQPATVDVDKLRADLLAVYPCIRRREDTDPRSDAYTAAVEREYRAAMGLEGTTRARAGGPQVAFLAEGYPAQRVLDDRTSYP